MLSEEFFKALKEPVTIQYTKFESIDSDGNTDTTTYGFRIYDDYECYMYCNIFDTFEELKENVNESNIVDYLKENYPEIIGLINGYPLSFNGKIIKK